MVNYFTNRSRGVGCETRFMFSAVSANDLCTGALVLASGVYPNLFRCWPLGERFCQIQVRDAPLNMMAPSNSNQADKVMEKVLRERGHMPM